jgi:hypothetical protein
MSAVITLKVSDHHLHLAEHNKLDREKENGVETSVQQNNTSFKR